MIKTKTDNSLLGKITIHKISLIEKKLAIRIFWADQIQFLSSSK